MFRVDRHAQHFLVQMALLDIPGRGALRQRAQHDIQPTRAQLPHQHVHRRLVHRDVQRRHPRLGQRDDARRERQRRTRHGTDGNRCACALPQRQQFVAGAVQLVQDRLRMADKDHAVRRGLDAAGLAHEQGVAQPFLDLGQRLRYRGLRDVHRVRDTRDLPVLLQCYDQTEMAQLQSAAQEADRIHGENP
ncbi:hypothetical protein FQZ97_1035500 [compost metagenome]